ncbi:MAG: DNA-binding response regulator [Omnitrophica WOR_2 bacterium GWF2_38_59]|nr:MAG: DNA-binding response regulator [Omnitrophica WOR_2 bacterium GWF2_38_59]OGX48346.1 MAG: DNA-binding response regulator [Omnitrophica WOR_2 bacterium RIFOXYA2_FULL_38_17]OGX54753.1 MAG: DNA-binding response regulator [Omnitrophica WOR_2 bacterium RIFOXYA12_FULL_38_10]OGX55087.1 MAG: DNA-binding response regulator [Omnitrophica WOR_2 bacterium RIFOXYC2_FULL_38_12]OGX58075.1 MAG: DNA-binding response regulator [Omnitrophica WOR_2 bacterium RIFOXYB2_FULL_38_16]HBG61741.1 DNA-binding respon
MVLPRILIVEDDKNISKLIKYNLEKAGFACDVSITGEDALDMLDSKPIDLIILDIMLPKMDGFETCRHIKQDKMLSSIPIIMLTAKGEEVDKVVGFELGADDYVVKPFSPRELILRVKAVVRRGKPKEEAKDILSVGEITVDVPRHKVTVDKRDVTLTLIEFKLLLLLINRKGRVQSRETLLEDVWDISSEVTTRTIDTHIKRVREKLGKSGKLIETVRGIGYRINEGDEN